MLYLIPAGHSALGIETMQDQGASVPDQATQAPPEAATASSPSGECPSRIADLELALDYALRLLVIFEPGDSRAVSNMFVAMAGVLCNVTNEESRQILRAAIAEDDRVLAKARSEPAQ